MQACWGSLEDTAGYIGHLEGGGPHAWGRANLCANVEAVVQAPVHLAHLARWVEQALQHIQATAQITQAHTSMAKLDHIPCAMMSPVPPPLRAREWSKFIRLQPGTAKFWCEPLHNDPYNVPLCCTNITGQQIGFGCTGL